MSVKRGAAILAAAAVMGLAGCAANDPYNTTSSTYPARSAYPDVARYGYVESVETVVPERRDSMGVGAIGGAIAGGVLGSQVGGGSGRTAATVGGAVLGGVAGHQVEKRMRENEAAAGVVYHFRVRMDDGSYQTFKKETHHNIRAGDRVRVEQGNIFLM